jgi:two-component system, OmpR family, sensor histidine kinase MprB
MTLRTKFAAACAVIAGVAIGVSMAVSYDAARSLLKVNTAQTFRALVDSVAERARETELRPVRFAAPADEHSVEYKVVRSRQVITQVLDSGGRVMVRDPERTRLPVTAADRHLAGRARPGDQAEQAFTSGRERYQMVTVALGGGRGAVQIAQLTTETERLLGHLAELMTLVGIVVFVLAGLAGWFIARRVTRRLERLIGTAEQVTASGKLDVPVPTTGQDEVGRLGSAFDSMLDQLGQARDDQHRLVQDAGHELKTPLTSVRTNVTVLRRFEELSAEDRARLVDDLDGQTRELTTLVDELIELATEQREEEPYEPLSLPGLALRIADRARGRTAREIVVDVEDAVIFGRVNAMERAITNLIDNAAKFDPSGGPIELVVRSDRVTVLDRGPGLAAADIPRIFDRFYRTPAARGMPGSGLGLAIVRKVAETHHGTVFAENRPGGGAAIGFILGPASSPSTWPP